MICPFAIQHPGAPNKKNAGHRTGKGAVLHSMEGYLTSALPEVENPAIPLSWHFSVGLDGTLFQHYDTTAQCWHAHAAGNVAYVGIEHEGVAGEPETDAQVATDIRLLAWLAEQEQWPGFERRNTLWEHNEVPGNATACPSGRIRWSDILAGLAPAPGPVIDGLGGRDEEGTPFDLWPDVVAHLGGHKLAALGVHYEGDPPDVSEQIWPK